MASRKSELLGGIGVINRVNRSIREYLSTGRMTGNGRLVRDLKILKQRMDRLNEKLGCNGNVEFSPMVQKMFKMVAKDKLVESFSVVE